MSYDTITNYTDLVTLTQYRYPNYKVIDFESFLIRKLNYTHAFIDASSHEELRRKIKSKFSNESDSFKQAGIIRQFNMMDLVYYQKEVGINGPQHSNMDDPVHVVKTATLKILWNGYHRVFSKLLGNQIEITGYELILN